MKQGTISLLWGVSILAPSMSVSDAQQIYWADAQAGMGHGQIRRASLDGADVESLVTTGLAYPGGVALDASAGKMYWTNALSIVEVGKIRRSDLDGSNVVDLLAPGLSQGIALDHDGGKIYWTAPDGVYRANLNGSDAEPIVTTFSPSYAAFGVALDLTDGKIYWTESTGGPNTTGRIRRANLDGSSAENLIGPALADPFAIALDVAGGKMYWTDTLTRLIKRADLNGAGSEELIGHAGPNIPQGVTLDLANQRMYWTVANLAGGLGKIRRADLTGLNAVDVISQVIDPKGIALLAAVQIVGSDPPNCAVDARQPHDISSNAVLVGWDSIDLHFSGPVGALSPADFTVEELSDVGFGPFITSVMSLDSNSLRLTLNEPIEAGLWTCFHHHASMTKTCLGYLPGDVSHDLASGPLDILKAIDDLNGVVNPPYPIWQIDVNRSGAPDPSDVLRVVDLLNGADAFVPWIGVALPDCP